MKLIMGGLIAVILLGLYVYSVVFGIAVVDCLSTPGCTRYTASSFTDGMVQALTTIGGLVSALVIAELAITPPQKPVMARAITGDDTPKTKSIIKWVTGLYLLVWVATGFASYLVGQIQHPKVLQPLTDVGQAWLGLAVAAAYAYLGISGQTDPDH